MPDQLSSPCSYFTRFFDEELFQLIAEQTNLYSCQLRGTSINTNPDEVRSFIGMKLIMGIVKMPSVDDYWSEGTRYQKIANVMSVKRFQCLSRMIHFQDNAISDPDQDRLFKVRPVLEHMRKKCLKIESKNQFSIDEMMVPYKGIKAGSLRQYLPSKPHHWGFKIFVRAGVSGMVYDFLVYTGKSTFGAEQGPAKEPSTTQWSVLSTLTIFFTTLPLIVHLNESLGLRSLGTIRKNRLKGCHLEDDHKLKRQGRGSFDYRVDNEAKVAIVKWFDNKAVTLASSCAAVSPVKEVRRFSKEQKKRVGVTCPNIVTQYNVHMGGVDLADMMVALYRTPAKSHRWYMSLFWQMADIALNNAWLLYRRDAKSLGEVKHKKLKTFRLEVADGLIHAGKKKARPSKPREDDVPTKYIQRPVTPRPVDDIRYDKVDHFPVFTDRGRCKLC
ncbi:hypothetical protein ABG768_018866 [Culter alburnus]|uniref:PiggyBac transposable element-derived protein domain-containing protein n=1 Tax=Culter alburnus TaxID=194366 RepID=A0AAW2ATH2_CULAL